MRMLEAWPLVDKAGMPHPLILNLRHDRIKPMIDAAVLMNTQIQSRYMRLQRSQECAICQPCPLSALDRYLGENFQRQTLPCHSSLPCMHGIDPIQEHRIFWRASGQKSLVVESPRFLTNPLLAGMTILGISLICSVPLSLTLIQPPTNHLSSTTKRHGFL